LRLKLAEMAGRRGIVQLRWATFGAPSQVNAQPKPDCVHSGLQEEITL